MLDGLNGCLAAGGRLMYLGGNGFYWVTTAPADDPFLIEVRRGQAGTRVWESAPGEWHQAMTGERGGLWRHRGRSPQSLAGVGFTAQGFDVSLPYRMRGRPGQERAAFILEGIDAGVPLGGSGSAPRRAGRIRDRPGRPGSGHPGGRGGDRVRPRVQPRLPGRGGGCDHRGFPPGWPGQRPGPVRCRCSSRPVPVVRCSRLARSPGAVPCARLGRRRRWAG